jgi:hypothetical protein
VAESTLAIVWQEHQARVGKFLGYGAGPNYGDPPWSATQQFDIDGDVASGLRQFYWPTLAMGDSGVYLWSFLKPTARLGVTAGQNTMPLPDDFGGVEGEVTVSSTVGIQWFPLKFDNEGLVYEQYAQFPTTTGRPQKVAQQHLKGTGPTQGQRSQLLIWPMPDQAYVLQFEYFILPNYLSVPFPYAYGGAEHAETILESCLAIAELRQDDAAGVHGQQFAQRLLASIGQDRKKKPQSFGINLDRSDYRQQYDRWRSLTNPVTFNGVAY